MLLTTQCVSQCVVFGNFRFNVPTRELLKIGNHGSATPVTLGSRAADLLHLFLDRPGELITKNEIMNAVWPNMAVEESNLTVQISALRRALGGGRNGARYIQTVPGRGYRFTPWVDDFAPPAADTSPEHVASAGRTDAIMLTVRTDGLPPQGSRPPRHSVNALPELAPLPLPFSRGGGSSKAAAGALPMAASRARRTDLWWLSWLNGAAGIILGLVLITAPGATTVALASFLGLYWIMMGTLALVRVFVDQAVPWVWSLATGAMAILAGIFALRHLLVAAVTAPTVIVLVLGVQGLVAGGLELIIGIIGARIGSFILATVYLLVGLALLGSLIITALAMPLVFGVLLLLQGGALTLVALRTQD